MVLIQFDIIPHNLFSARGEAREKIRSFHATYGFWAFPPRQTFPPRNQAHINMKIRFRTSLHDIASALSCRISTHFILNDKQKTFPITISRLRFHDSSPHTFARVQMRDRVEWDDGHEILQWIFYFGIVRSGVVVVIVGTSSLSEFLSAMNKI